MSGLYLGRLARWAIARPMRPVAITAHVRPACGTFCNLGHHTRLRLGQRIGPQSDGWLEALEQLLELSLVAGELLVHAHCYLYRPSLVPFGHRIPIAPHYFLKLKSAEALAQVQFMVLEQY